MAALASRGHRRAAPWTWTAARAGVHRPTTAGAACPSASPCAPPLSQAGRGWAWHPGCSLGLQGHDAGSDPPDLGIAQHLPPPHVHPRRGLRWPCLRRPPTHPSAPLHMPPAQDAAMGTLPGLGKAAAPRIPPPPTGTAGLRLHMAPCRRCSSCAASLEGSLSITRRRQGRQHVSRRHSKSRVVCEKQTKGTAGRLEAQKIGRHQGASSKQARGAEGTVGTRSTGPRAGGVRRRGTAPAGFIHMQRINRIIGWRRPGGCAPLGRPSLGSQLL